MANTMTLANMYSVYLKPSMGGQLVLRNPRTNQTSPKVRAAQIQFAEKAKGNNIAGKCKGKKGRSFYGCLRTEGAAQFK